MDCFVHVTPTQNVPKILKKGLLPRKPADMEDAVGVYLFRDITSAEDAIMNWLGDRFGDEEDLSFLAVDPAGIKGTINNGAASFEIISRHKIHPRFISVIK